MTAQYHGFYPLTPLDVQHPIWPENFRQHIGPRNAHHIRRLYTVCDMWAKMLLLSQSYVDGIMYALGTDLNRVLMLAIGHPRSMHRDVSFHFYNRFRQLPDRFWIRWASRAEVKERLTLALLREPLVEPDLDHSMTAAEWLVYESPLRHETERVRVDRGHFELSAQLLLVHSHSFTVKSMLNAQLQNNTTRRQVWFTRTDVQATILGIQKPSHLPTPTRQ